MAKRLSVPASHLRATGLDTVAHALQLLNNVSDYPKSRGKVHEKRTIEASQQGFANNRALVEVTHGKNGEGLGNLNTKLLDTELEGGDDGTHGDQDDAALNLCTTRHS